jgi:hypothetical protein
MSEYNHQGITFERKVNNIDFVYKSTLTTMTDVENKISHNFITKLYHAGNEIGYFEIEGSLGEKMEMGIDINDGYQGQKHAWVLIWLTCELIRKNYPEYGVTDNKDVDQLLFIDADASDGFWKHLGLVVNRHGDSDRAIARGVIGAGFEKFIPLRKLYTRVYNKLHKLEGGRRKNTKKKTLKNKRNKKRKTIRKRNKKRKTIRKRKVKRNRKY